MRLKTVWSMARSRHLGLIARTMLLARPVYKATFLAAASSSGLLTMLHAGPVTFDRIAAVHAPDPQHHASLTDWLSVGCLVGVLAREDDTYRLASRFARLLADPKMADAGAMLEEIVRIHQFIILNAPARLRNGQGFSLDEQDGVLVARASRILEPFVVDALEGAFERFDVGRIADVGCGTGIALRHAARIAPEVVGLGLELQPEVAELARQNMAAWSLDHRFDVEAADVMAYTPDEPFDLVMLNNNLAYFDVRQRTQLFARLRAMIRPGGGLLVTHPVRGRDPAFDTLSSFLAGMDRFGRFPAADEVRGWMQPHFSDIVLRDLALPGQGYIAFMGTAT